MLRVNLFDENQFEAFRSSVFDFKNSSFILLSEIWNVVSSAKRIEKKFVAAGRSFINNKKRRGPKTDPWGTPHSIFFKVDLTPFNSTNCCLPKR